MPAVRSRYYPEHSDPSLAILSPNDHDISRPRKDAGEGSDIDLVGNQHQRGAAAPLAHETAQFRRLRRAAIAILEKGVKGGKRLHRSETQ